MTNKTVNTIFQYRPPTIWALDNLFCRVIYFRSPGEFNDPYDCRMPPALRDLTGKQLAFLRRTNPDIWGTPADNAPVPKKELIARINKELEKRHSKIAQQCGVACFSKRNDNLPMWSHYAGGGEGFCLEFDSGNDLPKGEGLPKRYDVSYSGEFQDVYRYVKTLAERRGAVQYPKLFLTHKYREWKYEEEVRMFRGKPSKFTYLAESLKAVYFGTKASNGTKALVCTIINQQYKDANVKMMKSKLNNKTCRIEFTEIR